MAKDEKLTKKAEARITLVNILTIAVILIQAWCRQIIGEQFKT